APDADIFVVGYPLLVAAPEQANCHDAFTKANLSTGELTMIRTLGTQFNNVTALETLLGGVYFVPGAKTFLGHEACTSDQSAEWINEVTSSDLSGSFHPNQLGYIAYAKAVNALRADLYKYGEIRLDPSCCIE
ncbi:MAG: hypothetical protein JO011_21270, partial [Ktedonobacteraceae bacterium]|nr:hypothetical protein [Ktedonobacteraceae bacterium]